MLKAGRVVAEGTPDELKTRLGSDRLELVLADPADVPRVVELAAPLADGEVRVVDVRVSVPVRERTKALVVMANSLHEARIEPEDITLRRPTLDEVFLHLTGAEAAA